MIFEIAVVSTIGFLGYKYYQLEKRFNQESSRERRIRHLELEKQAKARKKAVKRTCLKVHKNNRNLHAIVEAYDRPTFEEIVQEWGM